MSLQNNKKRYPVNNLFIMKVSSTLSRNWIFLICFSLEEI